MTEAELEAIEARFTESLKSWAWDELPLTPEDVSSLIAEVRRLQTPADQREKNRRMSEALDRLGKREGIPEFVELAKMVEERLVPTAPESSPAQKEGNLDNEQL